MRSICNEMSNAILVNIWIQQKNSVKVEHAAKIRRPTLFAIRCARFPTIVHWTPSLATQLLTWAKEHEGWALEQFRDSCYKKEVWPSSFSFGKKTRFMIKFTYVAPLAPMVVSAVEDHFHISHGIEANDKCNNLSQSK